MDDKKNPRHCKNCMERLPMFNLLTDEQLDIINQTRCKVKFRPGEVIFKQGATMTHVIVLTEGLAKLYIEGIDNRNLIIKFVRPLTLIGGPGFLSDYKHHFTTMALEDTSACFVEVGAITEVLKLNQEFALDMIRWGNIQTQLHFNKVIELTQKGMHGRVASALLYLSNEIYKNSERKIFIKRQDLSDMTALSKESAIRILKELKDENIITVEGNYILINNVENLTQISIKG